MPFSPIFGGGVIYPSDATFLELSISATTELSWPVEQQIGGNVVADIIEVTASSGGLSVDIPDARLVSTGYTALFYNAGANTFTVRDQGGNTLMTVASGEAWEMYLRNNSTANGSWRVFQYGAGVSNANAAALAGSGIKAISTTLNQSMPVETLGGSDTMTTADRGKLILYTGGSGNITFSSPATLGDDWFFAVRNQGTGILTLDAGSSTIDNVASVDLEPGDSTFVVTNGSIFMTVGLGRTSVSVFDFIELDVAGSGTFGLTTAQQNRVAYELTGILTGDREIIVPNTVQQYWVYNNTTGAFTLTVKTLLGSGVAIPQGGRTILYSDGTDVVPAIDVSTISTFNNGTAGTPGVRGTTDPNTGMFWVNPDVLAFSTAGVQRSLIGATGTHVIIATTHASDPSMLVNGGAVNTRGLEVTSAGSATVSAPQLEVSSGAVAGNAVLSINAAGTAGTDDLSIWVDGATKAAQIINRDTDATADMTLQSAGNDVRIIADQSIRLNAQNGNVILDPLNFAYYNPDGTDREIGFRGWEPTGQNAGYTFVAGDRGRCISANTAGNFTIPNNVFTAGDRWRFINTTGGACSILQGAGVTIRLAGSAGTTGNRSVANFGVAYIVAQSASVFLVGGDGVT